MMNVKIRKLTLEDTENIVLWRNKSFVLENFIDRKQLTKENHIAYFNQRIVTKEVEQFIITCDEIDVGTVFLRDIDKINNKAEFGIFIGIEKYLARGIGALATKEILSFGFNELKLNKIFLRVLGKNTRAIKSYEKSGFKVEGCFKEELLLNDRYEDVVFMSVLRGEHSL